MLPSPHVFMYGVVCVQVDVLVDEVMSGGDPALV